MKTFEERIKEWMEKAKQAADELEIEVRTTLEFKQDGIKPAFGFTDLQKKEETKPETNHELPELPEGTDK